MEAKFLFRSEPDQVKDKIIIQWNVDHPFCHQVVTPNAGNP
jgi:hypothetical protein